MTRFQIYPETELACKYTKPLYKIQNSEILVKYEEGFNMDTGKLNEQPMATYHSTTDKKSYVPVHFLKHTGRIVGQLKPQDKNSTRLQELSLNNTHFGAIHYNIHLDMKLDYKISRIFQEMSLTELETLHQLCELERTQILQSLALAVLKIPYAVIYCAVTDQTLLTTKEIFLWCYSRTKKVSPLYVFEHKRCYKRIRIFYKKKYILLIHSPEELIFGIQQSHMDQKIATM